MTNITKINSNTCKVIGVLDDGVNSLSQSALRMIETADCVIGASRTLQLFNKIVNPKCEMKDLTGALSKVPGWVEKFQERNKRIVILATGDPLCHGIGSYLINKIGLDACEIIPNVSNIQLACARLGLSWQDIKISSVHTKEAGEWQQYADSTHGLYSLLQDLKQHSKLAVFTSPENTPDLIAKMMLKEGLGDKFQCAVVENTLTDKEHVYKNLTVSEK